MKMVPFVAALMLSGAAIAQPAQPTPPEDAPAQPTETETAPAPTAPETTAPEAPQPTAPEPQAPEPPAPEPMPPAQEAAPSAPTTVAPGNQAPERDARGIPVVSDPATAPAGVNQPIVAQPGTQFVPNPNASAAFATQPSTENYQACSKTVTDNCVQAYERGARPK